MFTSSTKQWSTTYTVPECNGVIPCTPALRWLYLCAVWNKFDLKLFVNGKLESSDGLGTEISSNLNVGSRTLFMESLLLTRDVRLWDYSLSENDVMLIYNESKGYKNIVIFMMHFN